MKAIINFMNWLTDMDWAWWPILRFRPSKDKDIDSIVVLKVTSVFGTALGIIIAATEYHRLSPAYFIVIVMISWVAFFIIYRITFALAWNSRARLLRKNRDKQDA